MHEHISKIQIEKSINDGIGYLMSCQRDDGGLKFESEKSTLSGIWTTAESLEFFLSSKYVPITAFDKIRSMLDFIISTQRDDGSWPVLIGDNPGQHQKSSTIATGHCVFVLRKASIGNYLNNEVQKKIELAIIRGQKWLKGCKAQKDGYAFWPGQILSVQLNPSSDESARMDYIFSTFYAMMAFLPINGIGSNPIILDEVYRFFISQAEYFCDTYGDKDYNQFDGATASKIASSICRIASALFMLKDGNIPITLKERIGKAIRICGQNPFITTGIDVNTQSPGFSVQEFNNNTPFDYGMALMWLETDVESLRKIIEQYLQKQTSDGGWYLSFSKAFSRKVWTTAEALMLLERSLDKYNEVAYKTDIEEMTNSNNELKDKLNVLSLENSELRNSLESIKTHNNNDYNVLNDNYRNLENKNKELLSKLKDLRFDRILSAIITFFLALGIVIYVAVMASKEPTKFTSNIVLIVIIPTALAALYDVVKLIITLVKKGFQNDD